jgi:PAS domain S-box-containing protein
MPGRADEDTAAALALPLDVLDQLLEGCQIIGFDYTYLYLNEIAAAQGRMPRDQLVGRTMPACFPGIERTPMFGLLQRCLTERTHQRLENEFAFEDGARIVFELRIVPVPQGACILSLDITERRHRLAAIVQDSDDAIISRGLDGLVTSWNRGAEQLFGYTCAEMIGQHFQRTVLPEHSLRSDLACDPRARGEQVAPVEILWPHKDGRAIEVSVTVSPYRDASGAVVGVSLIAREITELKRIQRALVAANNATELANRELEAFASSVAHDLRAPLRSIDGFSMALLEDCADELGDPGHAFLRRIRQAAALMGRLIDNLLKLSQTTRQELVRRPIDLSALARATVARLQLGDPERAIDVDIAPGMTAEGDAPLLAVVLDNLIGNAWKFTAKRDHARIEIGRGLHEGVPSTYVRDNGVGFSMVHAKRLFLPFQRLHAADEFEGTGIGLATVQRIVQRHGGRIWTEGEVGVGATFWFTLRAPALG